MTRDRGGPAPAELFAAAVIAACILVSVSFRLYEHDYWEHLAVGRAIWTLRSIPGTQLWTWPDFGVPVVNPSWGFSALIWPFQAVGGDLGLALWRWLTTLAVFALGWRSARALGLRGIPALLVFVIAGLVYRQRSQVRPETLASVLLALELWLLVARPPSRGRDLALVAVAWVWANVHISYALGLLVLGLRWGEGALAARPGAREASRGLGRVLLASAAISFVNPHGWLALWRPFEYALSWRHDPLISRISELQPLDWRVNLSNGLPLLLAGWPILAALRGWRRDRAKPGSGLDPFELALCVIFSALALSGNRFVATYAVVAAPWCARDLDHALRSREPARAVARAGARAGRHAGGSREPAPPAAGSPWRAAVLTSVVAVALCLHEWTHFENALGIRPDLRRVPVAACDFMAAHGVTGKGMNDFFLGGYMLWRFWPERARLPFMDIHPEDKSPELRRVYLDAFSSRRGWDAADARFHFDYVLVSRMHLGRPGLADVLDGLPEWALVSVDDAAALYVRRSGALREVAGAHGYRRLPGGGVRLRQLALAAALDPALAREVRDELARQGSTSPMNASFEPLRIAIAGALSAGP